MENTTNGLSQYEQFKINAMHAKRASGTAIGALAVGVGAAVAAIAAGAWAGSKAKAAKDVAEARVDATQRQLDTMLRLYEAERSERISGDQTITQTVTDTLSGQQASNLTAQQQSDLSAVNSVMIDTFKDAITGRSSLNPTPVNIYSAPQPCGCPGCGCGQR